MVDDARLAELERREAERDGVVKFLRLAATILGIIVSMLTLLHAVR
jgi:hypothetical protein